MVAYVINVNDLLDLFPLPLPRTERLDVIDVIKLCTTKTKEFNCDVFRTVKVCEEVVGKDYFWYRSVRCVSSEVKRKGGCAAILCK